jgi:hypothetical protein
VTVDREYVAVPHPGRHDVFDGVRLCGIHGQAEAACRKAVLGPVTAQLHDVEHGDPGRRFGSIPG